MNKSDLVKALHKDHGLSFRKAQEIVDAVFQTMSDALIDGHRIEVRGFGSFTVKHYEAYTGRNPKTGQETVVKPKRLPFFKAGKALAEHLNHR